MLLFEYLCPHFFRTQSFIPKWCDIYSLESTFLANRGKIINSSFRQILSHYMRMCYEKSDYTRAQDIYENICSKGIPLTKGFVHDLKFKLAIQTKICRALTINQKWILYIFFRYYFSPKYSNKLSKLQDSDLQKVIFLLENWLNVSEYYFCLIISN